MSATRRVWPIALLLFAGAELLLIGSGATGAAGAPAAAAVVPPATAGARGAAAVTQRATAGVPDVEASRSAITAASAPLGVPGGDGQVVEAVWSWPLAAFRVTVPYEAPDGEYGPGHRGIDLAPLSPAPVRAPSGGVIAFAARVVDREVVTIDHGSGLVTTLEPVVSSLPVGSVVERGEGIGKLGVGGHTAPGELHFGVRRDGAYINPMLLLGGVPRAVLLPCCD